LANNNAVDEGCRTNPVTNVVRAKINTFNTSVVDCFYMYASGERFKETDPSSNNRISS